MNDRHFDVPTTFETEERDGRRIVRGTAIVYHDPADPGTEYRPADDLAVRVDPAAVRRSLVRHPDVRLLYAHNDEHLLARTPGTLKLRAVAQAVLANDVTIPSAHPTTRPTVDRTGAAGPLAGRRRNGVESSVAVASAPSERPMADHSPTHARADS